MKDTKCVELNNEELQDVVGGSASDPYFYKIQCNDCGCRCSSFDPNANCEYCGSTNVVRTKLPNPRYEG